MRAIARGRATFAALAHVVVSKFDHHLPLYRQAEMMAAQGITIDRATLAGWTSQAAALLDPITARIRETGQRDEASRRRHADAHPRSEPRPHADGAPVDLCRRRSRQRLGSAPLAWYRFTPDRAGAHPQAELATFTGYLQADAFAGFDKLYASGRVTEVACWAHLRRQFVDLHRTKPTALTTDLLGRIAGLCAVEGEVRGRPPDVRRAAREQRTRPLVDALRRTLDEAARRLSPRSEMGKAVVYGLNIAERALRGIAVGRKNWLFAGSRAGGERAAALLTVIETAKLNGVKSQAYIADVLAKLANDWPAQRWDELMPWNLPQPPELAKAA